MTATQCSSDVSSVFSTSVFSALGAPQDGLAAARLGVLTHLVAQEGLSASLASAFDKAHERLSESYRNEYFYKNTIISKVIFGRHSARTASALLELPSGSSVADLVIFNGTSTAYEIKTDLDSFARLPSQLADYMTRFEHVNVVTSISRAAAAEKIVPDSVGIVALRPNGALSVVKASQSGLQNLRQESMFQMIRQKEAIEALRRACGFEVDVPSGDIWARCREVFLSLPIEVAHRESLRVLKKRGMKGAELASRADFPASLRALAYGTEMSGSARNRLSARLMKSLKDVAI
jgi:hypothetical protein